jgi:hypothetical protein
MGNRGGFGKSEGRYWALPVCGEKSLGDDTGAEECVAKKRGGNLKVSSEKDRPT